MYIYTVHIQCFWQGNCQIHNHIRYTVYTYGSGQPYIYDILGRKTTKYTIIYGVYIRF
jgi:hypothetical protein